MGRFPRVCALALAFVALWLAGGWAAGVPAFDTLEPKPLPAEAAALAAAEASGGHPDLLGLELIADELPLYDPASFQMRLPHEGDSLPPMRALLSRERYWAEDGHLDAVVQLDAGSFAEGDALSVRIAGTDGEALSEIEIRPLPGPRFVFYPRIPRQLAEGGAGEIRLVWSGAEGPKGESSHPFRVERCPEPVARSGRIPVRVANGEGVAERQVPFTVGVPFPRGAMAEEPRIRLVAETPDGVEAEIPLQVLETARWSRFGPLKWALCDFSLDLDGAPVLVHLEYGPEVRRQEAPPIRVEKGAGFPAVEAGRLRIDGGLWFDAEGTGEYRKVLGERALSGAFVVREDGRRYAAPLEDRYTVEERGPRKVVLRREGWYREEGTGDEFCLYITRYAIYRDSPLVRIFHTWIFTGDGNRERIANMGWEFPLAGGFRGRGFLGSFEDEGDWLQSGRLLQYDYEHFVSGEGADEYERAGGRSAGVAAAEGEGLLLFFGARDFWQNYPSELEFLDGALWFHNWPRRNRPAGYTLEGELLTGSGEPALPSAARHAHYQEGRLTLSEWRLNVIQARFAHEGELLDFRFPDAMARDPIWVETMLRRGRERASSIVDEGRPDTANAQGIARTEEMWLYLAPEGAGLAQGARLMRGLNRETLRATVAPAWVAASGAFHEIRHKDTENYPEDERVHGLLARFPGQIIERLGAYGMWVFGDIPSYSAGLLRREPRLYRAYRKGHQGWPYAWVPFARSGEPDLLRLADTATRQMADANYCHYWTEDVEEASGPDRFRRLGRWHRSPIPWAARRGPTTRSYEEKCDFFWHAYYLTGYRRARDVALSWGEQAKQEEALPGRGPIAVSGSNRSALNLQKSFIKMYEATFDPWFLVAFHALAEGHLHRFHTAGYRVHGAGENVEGASHFWRTGDADYLRFTGREAYRGLFLAAADFWGDHNARPSWARGAAPTLALNAYAWTLTGEEYYLRRAAALLDIARISITDDPGEFGFLLGDVPSIGMTRYHGWYMQQFPHALAAFERAGRRFAPVFNSFHVHVQSAADDDDADAPRYAAPAVFLRKADGQALALDFSGLRLPDSAPEGVRYDYRIVGPGGQEALSGSWPLRERNLLEIPAEAPAGTYRLHVEGGTDLRENRLQGGVEVPVSPPGTPEVVAWPPGQRAALVASTRPVQFWFMVPEGTESFAVDIARAGRRASVWGPDGELAWDMQNAAPIRNVRAEVEVVPGQAGRLWRITFPRYGDFALDPQIPPVLTVNPERWFEPEWSEGEEGQ